MEKQKENQSENVNEAIIFASNDAFKTAMDYLKNTYVCSSLSEQSVKQLIQHVTEVFNKAFERNVKGDKQSK